MALAEYTRPYLYAKQLDAIFCPERLAIIEASTKSGKTVGSIAWFVEQGLSGQAGWNYWWVAPGYNQAEIAYRRIKQGLTKGSFVAYDSPTPRISLVSGAWLWFKSGDNPDALYGEDVYAAVMDEASRIMDTSWHAVRSTLTATRGPIRIIGNVKGRKNWFYQLARRAEALMLSEPDAAKRRMHYARITADDAVAAGVLDAEEIEDAKSDLPESIFRELYYAEPGDDTGNPFGLEHIRACTSPSGLANGPIVAWGIDLAKSQDYLVLIGLNESGEVAGFHRWRGIPWRASIQRIWSIVGEDTSAMVDSTGVGDPVLEELQNEHGNFFGFHFSSTSKQKLMEGLAVSIQSREMRFPQGFITQELEMFEYEQKPNGVRYSAPEGQNDDCVCALALARQMWTETAPGANIMAYYAATSTKLRQKESEAPVDDNRPWQNNGFKVEIGNIVENELEDLYEQEVQRMLPSAQRNCFTCGQPVVGASRVTDGELFWHQGCAGANARPRLTAELVQ